MRHYLSLTALPKVTKWRGIHGRERRRLIKLLKLRDGDTCQICGEPFYEEKEITIDHKIARCMGGNDSKRNLQLLCGRCNKAKGREENQLVKIVRAK